MINRSQLNYFSSEDLIVYYLGLYNQEYGNNKGLEILSKIQSSKKIREFITKLRIEELSPGDKGFISMINTIPYFFFSKGETLGYGALFAIQSWIALSSNDPFQLDSDIIHRIIVETIFIAKSTKYDLSGKSTFFDKYSNLLENLINNSMQQIVDRNALISNSSTVKTEITFDSILCSAIKSGQKREFRVRDNLEYINLAPDLWKLDRQDKENGAFFSSEFLGTSILVHYPYKPGSIINVYDLSNSSKIYPQIKIIGYALERIRDVDPDDAIKEGFGAYKERINEILSEDYTADAELCLFHEDWAKKYGDHCKATNEWIWCFVFKIIERNIEEINLEELIA